MYLHLWSSLYHHTYSSEIKKERDVNMLVIGKHQTQTRIKKNLKTPWNGKSLTLKIRKGEEQRIYEFEFQIQIEWYSRMVCCVKACTLLSATHSIS